MHHRFELVLCFYLLIQNPECDIFEKGQSLQLIVNHGALVDNVNQEIGILVIGWWDPLVFSDFFVQHLVVREKFTEDIFEHNFVHLAAFECLDCFHERTWLLLAFNSCLNFLIFYFIAGLFDEQVFEVFERNGALLFQRYVLDVLETIGDTLWRLNFELINKHVVKCLVNIIDLNHRVADNLI
jgi:hypothetical protein